MVSLTRVLWHGEGRNVVDLVVMAEGGVTTPPLDRSRCSARSAKIHVSTRMRHSRPCLPCILLFDHPTCEPHPPVPGSSDQCGVFAPTKELIERRLSQVSLPGSLHTL